MPPDRTPISELPLKPDVLLILLTLASGPMHAELDRMAALVRLGRARDLAPRTR